MVGTDRIGDYLSAGHSLVICCKACPRIIEWTPPELKRRFGATPQVSLGQPRPTSCLGELGFERLQCANLYQGDADRVSQAVAHWIADGATGPRSAINGR